MENNKKKRKAIRQDFIKEIKNSLNRFLSIMFIVALGVAFFSGIRASQPDMKISADSFYDSSNLMDIRVLSTLGLTDEDVREISTVDGVEAVEPSYSVDVLLDSEEIEMVLKVMSETDHINQIRVLEGRLPQLTTECLVDERFLGTTGFNIGDSIHFASGTEDDLSESLKENTFTIVGVGSSSKYLSFNRGSSSIGNGKVNSFVVVPKDTFTMEAYTEIFITAKEAKGLISYTPEYDKTVEGVADNIEKIADRRKEARYQEVLEEPKKDLADAKEELAKSEREVNEKLADAEKKIEDAKIEIADGEEEIKKAWEELKSGKNEIETNKNNLTDKEKELKQGQNELNRAESDFNKGKKLFDEKKAEYEEGVKTLNTAYESWNTSMKTWKEKKEELDKSQRMVDKAKAELAAQKEQLEPYKDLYPDKWQEVLAGESALKEKQNELNGGKKQLEDGKSELDAGKEELDKQQKTLKEAGKVLSKEEQKLLAGEKTLAENRRKITEGLNQIEAGWKELRNGEKEIRKSESLLLEKEAELQDGKSTLEDKIKEYEEGKETAAREIEDAKKEIADGEEKLSKIEFPKWFVLDRNSIQTYVEYGQDSERIGNIGKVFPAIFFLVAALVSLTTMTRMVEEQRTQIGTYKALGYKNAAIAGKYILYAFLASILGSLLGVLIGEQLLPKVIIKAYGILYQNIPEVITPYNMYFGMLSTIIAVLCTTMAAYLACYKELMETPAQLMRPAAPKAGKRVILERIPWIWKKLNFTTKSTIRNLLRYKKRFFMTVFGIGGCMALLLVGFGLKDSISAMSDIQYVDLWHQDSIITLKEKELDSDSDKGKNIYEFLQNDSNVEDFIKTSEKTVDAGYQNKEKSVTLIVPEDKEHIKSFIEFRDRKTYENYDLEEDGVIITEKLASLLEVKVGDTIDIKDGEVSSIQVKVSHIVENYMLNYIFMSPAVYRKLHVANPEYNSIYLKSLNKDAAYEENFASQVLNFSQVSSIMFTSYLQEQIHDMLKSLNIVVYVLIISAGLLAFIVLYNLNNININERKRELATLKVLGFQDMEVATYVYRENVILTAVGVLVGIFLGIILHRFVILTAEIDTIMFGRQMKGISYVFSGLLTFGFSGFVNYFMFYKLRKIDMVESLKSVE
ncbi:ABC transporter permease [Anaerocolumna aminovalerica]|uniref:FtsX-like permease family protein n=1 Tax=Anaerocolumna aminovalerica TaxID=1527 RepID=UPI0031E60E7B